ncbi:unnamed protein product [Didymodactylos carnosus]|uniref:Uncharacterized protein n=1 Tax=Didymodactylos carnosus TaxID=1234261 RepID=A0A813VWW0_9BILA|nr:unnamed protein product [Didymodactylos carnosus]CAF3639842.1 unnamed protein product [Didymodactylos carnosus]
MFFGLKESHQRTVVILLLIACVSTFVHCAVDTTGTSTQQSLEESEETVEDQQENDAAACKSEANQFLTYDKCMQRMKCPSKHRQECSEECKAGNTEEEIEEHAEITHKPKHKKRSSKKDEKPRSNSRPVLRSNISMDILEDNIDVPSRKPSATEPDGTTGYVKDDCSNTTTFRHPIQNEDICTCCTIL